MIGAYWNSNVSSNNFGIQEPCPNKDIKRFARDQGATFPLLGKLDCENGENTVPVFLYLKYSLPAGWFGRSFESPLFRVPSLSSSLSFENDLKAFLEK